ncbi:hypothetical protein D039_3100B, partial [Vibrio parahaemolyticus EKP-028]
EGGANKLTSCSCQRFGYHKILLLPYFYLRQNHAGDNHQAADNMVHVNLFTEQC